MSAGKAILGKPRARFKTQNWLAHQQIRLAGVKPKRIPSRIHIPYRIYSIHSTFILVEIVVNHAKTGIYGFGGRIALYGEYSSNQDPYATRDFRLVPGDQEQSLPVDRLPRGWRKERSRSAGVGSTLVGSDPPGRPPIAQKYLLMVLGRSASALDSMGDAFLSVSSCEVARPK